MGRRIRRRMTFTGKLIIFLAIVGIAYYYARPYLPEWQKQYETFYQKVTTPQRNTQESSEQPTQK